MKITIIEKLIKDIKKVDMNKPRIAKFRAFKVGKPVFLNFRKKPDYWVKLLDVKNALIKSQLLTKLEILRYLNSWKVVIIGTDRCSPLIAQVLTDFKKGIRKKLNKIVKEKL